MDRKNFWLWAVGGISVLLVSSGIFFITLPKQSSPNRPRPVHSGIVTPTSGSAAPTTPSSSTPTPSENAPFVITTMTHMEEDFTDDTNKKVFEKHVIDMRWAMDLFDEYGAKLTFETDQPFAKANTNWGINILKEAIAQGHGVGTHAGFGAKAGLSLDELTEKFIENKTLVDNLVGAENNQGVSGGTGPTDWILGAAAAGFHFYDGVTGFGYLSMPASNRPSSWTNSYIINTGYHDSIPPELIDRIYPIPMKDATDFVPDAGAPVTMMSGDIGELSSLGDGRTNCFPSCVLEQDDVDAVEGSIKEILSIRDTSRFAKMNFHIPMKLLTSKNETVLRSMLAMIQEYTDAGKISWDTQLGAYKQYVRLGE